MNQSDLSEAFGQQIEELTVGTMYEIVGGPAGTEDKMDQTEARIRSIMYSLWMGAQSEELARRMERRQAAHFAQLYEFSYGVPVYDAEYPVMKGTENLALMILDEKQAYSRRIEKLRKEYALFRDIMEELDPSSKTLLIAYFENGEKVEYKSLRAALKKHLAKIERIYKQIEIARDDEAERIEEQYQLEQGRIPVMKGRVKVYMTEEEHQQYKKEQEEQRRDWTERLRGW